jgi:hypothetical protein
LACDHKDKGIFTTVTHEHVIMVVKGSYEMVPSPSFIEILHRGEVLPLALGFPE